MASETAVKGAVDERRLWTQQQQQFRRILATRGEEGMAIALFLSQHAAVHSAAMSGSDQWSFEDEVLSGLSEDQLRHRPAEGANSIIWIIWHIARIEDVTMNILVAGCPQVLSQDGWLYRLGLLEVRELRAARLAHVGTGMGDEEVAEISKKLEMESLRAYRIAVGRRTRQIVTAMRLSELKEKIDPARVRILLQEGALGESALGLAQAWGGWRKRGMLTMPATRHPFTHLNEARLTRMKLLRLLHTSDLTTLSQSPEEESRP